MFVAQGSGGFMVYDVASIGQQGLFRAYRLLAFLLFARTAGRMSPRATRRCMALADQPADRADAQRPYGLHDSGGSADQPLQAGRSDGADPARSQSGAARFIPIYNYAVITDFEEGLYLVNVDTLADGDPRNNQLTRAVTWNRRTISSTARATSRSRAITPYIIADAGLVVVSLDDPLHRATGRDPPVARRPRLGAPVPATCG